VETAVSRLVDAHNAKLHNECPVDDSLAPYLLISLPPFNPKDIVYKSDDAFAGSDKEPEGDLEKSDNESEAEGDEDDA